MAKRKTTVPPDEQALESVGAEALPPDADTPPIEEDMAAAPDSAGEGAALPDEGNGLADEGSPDGENVQEAPLEWTEQSREDSPPPGGESLTAPEEQQAAEEEAYNGILKEFSGSAAAERDPL